MTLRHTIIKSGEADQENSTYTVSFETSQLTEQDVHTLRKEAKLLLDRQDIRWAVTRVIDVLAANGRAMAIFRYHCGVKTLVKDVEDKIEADFKITLDQVASLVEMFEQKRAH